MDDGPPLVVAAAEDADAADIIAVLVMLSSRRQATEDLTRPGRRRQVGQKYRRTELRINFGSGHLTRDATGAQTSDNVDA